MSDTISYTLSIASLLGNNVRRIIALAASLLCIIIGGLYFFLRAPSSTHKKPHQDNPIQVSIPNTQEVLFFLELITEKKTLHPDWYELINPITYVVTNGIIQSVRGYLLLDLTKPAHVALFWKKDQSYPTILLALPSQQGVQGAKNLSRNLLPYGAVKQQGFQWHGNIQLPKLPKTSLSWEGTTDQILIAWRPFPSNPSFDLSMFASSAPPKSTTIQIKTEKTPLHAAKISNLDLSMTMTTQALYAEGSGQWDYIDTPKPSYPLEMIAGWSVPGIPPLQIRTLQDSTLCLAGDYPNIQQQLNITQKCDVEPTGGTFALFSEDFFSHINVPLKRMDISAWGPANTFTVQGNLIKEDTRGLFPLYIWLYELFTQLQ